MIKFTDEEKIDMFDRIAERFYCRNFGSFAKADFELMMFNFYMEKLINDNQDHDGTINYNKISDYRLSKELGITQQRVRNLKVKKDLIYHNNGFDWVKAFASLTKNARYDNKDQKVYISIPDPSLYLDIQNYIEESGGYIEKQLNGKVLIIRAEYYFDLIVHMESEDNQKKIIKELKKHFHKTNKENGVFDERFVGKSLVSLSSDIVSVVETIVPLISPGNIVAKALFTLLKLF